MLESVESQSLFRRTDEVRNLRWYLRMPSDSSNLPDCKHASSPAASDELQPHGKTKRAVETFAFDVSAGNVPTADDTLAKSTAALVRPSPVRHELAETDANHNATSHATSHASIDTAKPLQVRRTDAKQQNSIRVDSVEVTPQEMRIDPAEKTAYPNRSRKAARHSSWWITSLGVHVILLLTLAFSTLAIISEEKLELYASAAVYEPVDDFQDLEIDPTEDLDLLDEELSEPDPASLEEISSELLIEEPAITEPAISDAPTAEFAESLSDLGGLMGDITGDSGSMDSAVGAGAGGGMAKFFGTEVKARRILYMLDNSGGMRKNGKFEAAIGELKKSVSALDAKQEFYVIFYSDTVYPLFYPQGVRKFVRPNDRNFKLLDRWLATVELCGGNAIDEALAAAEVIQPEAVFLLTDGDLFTTEKKRTLLLNPVGRAYSIHTFGLGVGEKTKTADRLRSVADANSGTFRAILVTPEMEALANQMQRAYHNKEPGAVWGLKVGSRR